MPQNLTGTMSKIFLLLALVAGVECGPAAQAAETHQLVARREAGKLTQVKAHLETGGDLKVVKEGKVAKLKMSVVADMAYDEMLFATEQEYQSGVRHYRQAEATIKIEQGGRQAGAAQ